MSRPQRSFVESYTQTLAALWLTRCKSLRALDHNGAIFGTDLLIALQNDGRFSGRQLGAVVRASRVGESPPRITARELRLERQRFADHTFPVCMLAFPTSDGPGWFRWIVEPAACDGCTEVQFPDCIGFEPATDELLGRIVDRVNQWYDARRRVA